MCMSDRLSNAYRPYCTGKSSKIVKMIYYKTFFFHKSIHIFLPVRFLSIANHSTSQIIELF